MPGNLGLTNIAAQNITETAEEISRIAILSCREYVCLTDGQEIT